MVSSINSKSRPDGRRADEPRRARLRYLFAAAEGADHLLTGPIDGTASLVCSQLLFLESENPTKDIAMYINSPGGIVTSGLAIYDTMEYIRPDVSTGNIDQARHEPLLLTAGAAGKRFSLPHARIMTHQPSGGFQGQASDIEIHAKEILDLRRRLNGIYEAYWQDTETDRKNHGRIRS